MKCYADLHTHPASPLSPASHPPPLESLEGIGPLCTLTTQEPEKESTSPTPPCSLAEGTEDI